MTEKDLDKLIENLKSDDDDVRSAAADALGKIGDARAVEPLIEALGDGDSSGSWSAASALRDIADADAVEPLIGVLCNPYSSGSVRETAAEGLGKMGDMWAVEPLIGALRNKDYDLRYAAAGALVELLAGILMEAQHHADCKWIYGDCDCWLSDPDVSENDRILLLLEEAEAGEQSVALLTKIIEDNGYGVAVVAAWVLEKIDEFAVNAIGDDAARFREAAAESLEMLGHEVE